MGLVEEIKNLRIDVVKTRPVLQFQSSRPKNYSWSALLKRVFEIDVLVCQRCGGPVAIVAAPERSEGQCDAVKT